MLDIATRVIRVSLESAAEMAGVAKFCRLGSLCFFDLLSTMVDLLFLGFTGTFESVIRAFDPVRVFCLLRGTASSTSESMPSLTCSSSSEASVGEVTLLPPDSRRWINGELSVGILSLCDGIKPRNH